MGPPHLVVSFRRRWDGFQGSVARGTLCGKKMDLAPEMGAQWVMRCTSMLLKSSGRTR